MTTPTYEAIHHRLRKTRGSASEYTCCECPYPAVHWAYLYSLQDVELVSPTGQRYSEDLWGAYAPMCASCHRAYDLSQDPEMAEKVAAGALKGSHAPSTKAGAATAARIKEDPALAAEFSARGHHMAQVIADRMDNDPEYSARLRRVRSETVAQTNSRRKTCHGCGKTTNPGALANHQRATGHTGASFEEEASL